jgi:hypothetical protein
MFVLCALHGARLRLASYSERRPQLRCSAQDGSPVVQLDGSPQLAAGPRLSERSRPTKLIELVIVDAEAVSDLVDHCPADLFDHPSTLW